MSEKPKRSKFIYIGRVTKRAKFFVNYDGVEGKKGFWLPHSSIISEHNNEVVYQPWINLKIQFYYD